MKCKLENCNHKRTSTLGVCNMHYKRFLRNGTFDTKNKLSSHERFYNIWCKMKQRCFDKHENNYPRYGGKGITVCKRWLVFNNFYDDMYSSYTLAGGDEARMTIDRINSDLGYSRENCRWATYLQQNRNRRYAFRWQST